MLRTGHTGVDELAYGHEATGSPHLLLQDPADAPLNQVGLDGDELGSLAKGLDNEGSQPQGTLASAVLGGSPD